MSLRKIFENPEEERFIVVDFQNTLWKSWMAKPPDAPDLLRSDGYPTGHVYRFFRTIYKWKRDFMGHLVFCYEGGEKRRFELFPEYKANRKRDKDFDPGPDVRRLVSLITCTEIQPHEAEADDAIAAFVHKYPDAKHLILSSDKDLWTCRTPNTDIVSFQEILRDEDIKRSCLKHYGSETPKSITMAKALFGDKSDGLPGVPRLLKKHVSHVLKTAATPDEFFASLDAVPETTKKKLLTHEEQIRQMYEVVQLRTDVRMKRRDREGNREALAQFVREFESPSLLPFVQYMVD